MYKEFDADLVDGKLVMCTPIKLVLEPKDLQFDISIDPPKGVNFRLTCATTDGYKALEIAQSTTEITSPFEFMGEIINSILDGLVEREAMLTEEELIKTIPTLFIDTINKMVGDRQVH